MKTEQEAIRIREAYLRAGSIKAAAKECGCTWRTAKAALARDYSLNEGKTHRHVKQSIWNDSLGGVPPVLRFDNMAPVACWCRGRERKLTDAFSRFAVHCGFSPELCNPRSGWEKGNVECKVKYIRSNFFVPVPAFDSIEDLNGALEKWCIKDRDRKHYMKGIRIRDLLCSEATTFLPLPDTRFELWRQYITHTDRQGCIQFENNRYFAHRALARAQVIVCVSTHQVCIYDANRRLISSHLRLYGRGNVSQPVLELAQMLAQKPSALPYVVPTAKSALDDLRKLRIADRVGPVTQLIMTAGADTCTDIQFAMNAKKE